MSGYLLCYKSLSQQAVDETEKQYCCNVRTTVFMLWFQTTWLFPARNHNINTSTALCPYAEESDVPSKPHHCHFETRCYCLDRFLLKPQTCSQRHQTKLEIRKQIDMISDCSTISSQFKPLATVAQPVHFSNLVTVQTTTCQFNSLKSRSENDQQKRSHTSN